MGWMLRVASRRGASRRDAASAAVDGQVGIRRQRSFCLLVGLSLVLVVLVRVAPAEPSSVGGLVELIRLDPNLRLDVRYATSNNFMGFPLYRQARAFLQKPAAEALARANRSLHRQGYGIVVFDGYRPLSVTRMMWEASPPEWRGTYVADPSEGSRHNRGCAVDCSLVDLSTGREVTMPSPYDDFTERAHADYPDASPEATRLRDLLRLEMTRQGFTVLPSEWWHFDYRDWKNYPVMDLDFEQLEPAARP